MTQPAPKPPTQLPQWLNVIILVGFLSCGALCLLAAMRSSPMPTGAIGFTTPRPAQASAPEPSATAAPEDPEAATREIQTALNAARVAATVSRRGVYLDIRDERCTARTVRAVASEPRVLELLLSHGFRFVSCALSAQTVETRLPPRGVPVPPSIEWDRSFVATPTRDGLPSPDDHPMIWCTGLDGTAFCYRERAACVERWQGMSGDFAAGSRMNIAPCHLRHNLACYDTSGTERACFLSEEFCEEGRERMGRGGRCELRWAI